MAISNMQQPRQMYGLGSFVKKITSPIKKIFKSPIGKAALLGGAAYGLGALGGAGGFSKAKLMSRLSAPFGKMVGGGAGREFQRNALGKFMGSLNPFGGNFSGKNALIAGGLGATALPFLMGGEEEDEEIIDGFDITPDSIKNIRAMSRAGDSSLQNFRIDPRFAAKMGGENYYTGAEGGVVGLANGGGAGQEQMMQALQAEYMKYKQKNPTANITFEQFAKAVMQQQQQGQTQMAADGGRMGYNIGGPIEEQEVINEDTQEVVSNPDPMAELNNLSLEIFGKPLDQLDEREQEALQNFISQNPEEEIIDTDQTMVEDRVMANAGGMIDYMSSANPMAKSYLMEDTDIVDMYRPGGDRQMAAEGGIMDLGGMEKDYREDGGFVPIGGKEKADDVPARLSKNEFVFTADAVRNAGGGDIDQGAAVMQRMMDNLEQGGEISEESQGGNPAQEMFDTSQQLESRIA
jgi:hypothetical protein